MPRRRLRSTDPLVRDRNQLDILGAPGISGLSRLGSGPKGGTSVVVRPPANGLGTQIEHVTLHAVDGQTIASGGGTVSWDRIAGPPTEIRGFATAAEEIASSGSVGAIPVDLTGRAVVEIELAFDEDVTGTVTLRRTRGGNTEDIATEEGTGATFTWSPHVAIRANDTLAIVVDYTGTDGETYSSSTVTYSSSDVLYSSGAVYPASGRVQITVWHEAPPTSSPTLIDTVWLDTLQHTSDAGTYVESSVTLTSGHIYELTLVGNFTLYDTDAETSSFGTADTLMYSSPGDAGQTLAMGDADTVYADSTNSGSFPRHADLVRFDLSQSGTFTHQEMVGGPFTTPEGGHRYTLRVTGQGYPFRVRLADSTGSDNSGRIRIDVYDEVS